LILELGYRLGLRTAEVTDPRNLNTMQLRKSIAKSSFGSAIPIGIYGKGNKYREVVIPPSLLEKFDHFIIGRRKKLVDGPLICTKNGSPLGPGFASKVFAKCRTEIGDKAWAHRSFHALRKSFATNLVGWCYNKGLDPWVLVPDRLGHDSVETTKIYIFFDAVLNSRHDVIKRLSLEGVRFKKIWSNKY